MGIVRTLTHYELEHPPRNAYRKPIRLVHFGPIDEAHPEIPYEYEINVFTDRPDVAVVSVPTGIDIYDAGVFDLFALRQRIVFAAPRAKYGVALASVLSEKDVLKKTPIADLPWLSTHATWALYTRIIMAKPLSWEEKNDSSTFALQARTGDYPYASLILKAPKAKEPQITSAGPPQ